MRRYGLQQVFLNRQLRSSISSLSSNLLNSPTLGLGYFGRGRWGVWPCSAASANTSTQQLTNQDNSMKYFGIFALLMVQSMSSDYGVIKTCQNLQYGLDLRKVFILHKPDTIMVQVLFPISLIASIGMIAMYIKHKAIRQQPGDILLALSISSLFLLASYEATVIYNYQYPLQGPIPDDFDSFCLVTGYFYTLSFCCNLIYNVVFCLYFIIQLKDTLKEYRRKWLVHLISLCVLAIVGLTFYLTDCIGVSMFGVCGFKISAASVFVQASLIGVYVVIAIVSLLYFRKYVPRSSVSEQDWRLFTQYYFRYIFVISVDTLIRCTSDMISAINCVLKDPQQNLLTFITISNFFNLITPAIVFVVVLFHPKMKQRVRLLIRKICKTYLKEEQEEEGMGQDQTKREIQMQLLYKIMEQKKSALVYSLLTALYLEDTQVTGHCSLKELSDWNYDDRIELTVNEQSVLDSEQIRVPGLNVMNAHIASHAPRVFKTLMRLDGINNLRDHVNPSLNYEQIRKLVKSDGGKSGQFFFFTYDNKIILKTLLKKELTVIMSRLKAYVQHCIKNPYSLITKICGIYTITDLQTNQEYIVYAMRNLAGCDKKFVTRIYDMKGSKFDRRVINDYSQIEVGHINKTMKDEDFNQIQKKIYGQPGQIEQIKEILIEDSLFFRQQRLIDYSLIVIRLDINGLLNDRKFSRDSFMRTVANPYSIIFNEQNDSAYVIGIIDYLETWSANKKGEKLLKSIFFKTKSEDISAQSPEKYSQRFIKELVNKIF